MGKGQELYKRAKQLIPGGTMFLSKRPEMHLPEKWPCYFSKAKGINIWYQIHINFKIRIDCSY